MSTRNQGPIIPPSKDLLEREKLAYNKPGIWESFPRQAYGDPHLGYVVLGFTTFPFYIAGDRGIQPCSDQATCSR
jgi:hypothetical protein